MRPCRRTYAAIYTIISHCIRYCFSFLLPLTITKSFLEPPIRSFEPHCSSFHSVYPSDSRSFISPWSARTFSRSSSCIFSTKQSSHLTRSFLRTTTFQATRLQYHRSICFIKHVFCNHDPRPRRLCCGCPCSPRPCPCSPPPQLPSLWCHWNWCSLRNGQRHWYLGHRNRCQHRLLKCIQLCRFGCC